MTVKFRDYCDRRAPAPHAAPARDLGVNFTGAAIIVDLIERLEHLDAELARLRGQGWT